MSPLSSVETIESHGCSIALRRVEGAGARELFFLCPPPVNLADAGAQAEAIYRAILSVLESEGGSFESVVCETIFLRSARGDLEAIRAVRDRVVATCEGPPGRSATTEIEQPPLNEGACLEVSIQAVLPKRSADTSSLRVDVFAARSTCACAECVRSSGHRVHVCEEARLYVGGLCGPGDNAYEQTLGMFGVAEDLLTRAGMDFRDVVRTWIHLRDIDRDYADLNRGRRAYFESRGIDSVPASTGIGGGPVAEAHDVSLGLYAVRSNRPLSRGVMTTPTLNEAKLYGADFVRGMKIVETSKVALHVSGTASIDETGKTVHPGDFDAQVDRMLLNVAGLLEGQGADFGDVVSAVTYLKRPADAQRLREKLRDAGYVGFPNVLVHADVCRPELLCETEALAVLPSADSSESAPFG